MKKYKIIIGIPVGLILILVLVFFLVKIKNISVENSKIYTEGEVIEAQMSDKYAYNSLYLYLKFKLKGENPMPFAEDIKLEFNNPSDIVFKVYEKKISACVSCMNQYAYMDEKGVVIETLPTTLPAVTVITGVDVNTFKVGEVLGAKDKTLLKRLVKITELINYYNLRVKELKNTDTGIVMYVGKVKVYFGNKETVGEDEMAALSSALRKIRKKKLKGSIDMSDFVFGDKIILQRPGFKKAKPSTEGAVKTEGEEVVTDSEVIQ